MFSSCSRDIELKIHAQPTMKIGETNKVTITRTQSGNSSINNSGQDKIIYYLSSLDDHVEMIPLEGVKNERCQGRESTIQTRGKIVKTYNREIYFEEQGLEEMLVKVDCYAPILKFTMKESSLNLRLIIQDEDSPEVRDTVFFQLIR